MHLYLEVLCFYFQYYLKAEILNNIDTKIEDIKNQNESGFSELKQILTSLTTNLIENMKPENAVNIASGIVTGIELTGSTFMNVETNFTCRYCGTRVGLLIGSNRCPNCGQSIR